jgi:hypothetical protein
MLHRLIPKLLGRNLDSTPADVIVAQINEPRPLPLGRRDFGEWAHRIITGAMLPVVEGEDAIAFIESQKFALATMIMHLGPTESHKPDAFFIHSLRKSASNQVAHEILQELKLARMEKAKKEQERVEAEAKKMREAALAHEPMDLGLKKPMDLGLKKACDEVVESLLTPSGAQQPA